MEQDSVTDCQSIAVGWANQQFPRELCVRRLKPINNCHLVFFFKYLIDWSLDSAKVTDSKYFKYATLI